MKKIISVLTAALLLTVLCMSGCSDFGFNPIGDWHYVEEKTFKNDQLTNTTPAGLNPFDKNVVLHFGKSGTGTIGNTKTAQTFTYEYDSNSVTISGQGRMGNNFCIVYEVRENGNALVRVENSDVIDADGKTVKTRTEAIFRR